MPRNRFKASRKALFVAAGVLLSPLLNAADVNDLHWLSGCWALDGQESGSGENWMHPAGGSMFGVNRVISNGKTIAFEYMRIVTDDDGKIAFIVAPSGQSTTRFEILSLSKNEVVFENPHHDFPQRIVYKLEDVDTLLAHITGNIDGVARRVDFPMTRIECVNGIEAN